MKLVSAQALEPFSCSSGRGDVFAVAHQAWEASSFTESCLEVLGVPLQCQWKEPKDSSGVREHPAEQGTPCPQLFRAIP